MITRVELDRATLENDMRKLAKLTNKSLRTIEREQARLFLRDAIAVTPPFGDAPNTEGIKRQLDIGKHAVARDVRKAFSVIQDLEAWKRSGPWQRRMKSLLDKTDFVGAARLLRRIGIYSLEVVRSATAPLLNKLRLSSGRMPRGGRQSYWTAGIASVAALYNRQAAKVGLGKSGWIFAMREVSRRLGVPARIPTGLRGMRDTGGIYREGGSEAKPFIEVGNTIPYLQKHAGHVERRAWQNRLRNLPRQIDQIEKRMRKDLFAGGIKAT